MLKTKIVGPYTVSQFGTLANVRARVFRDKVEPLKKKPAKGCELSEDDAIYNAWLDEWVTMACLIQPVISLDEYAEMSPRLMKELNEAVEEVNSDGLADMQEAATPAQAKKKRNAKT